MVNHGAALVFEDNPLVQMDAEESLQAMGFSRIHAARSEAVAIGLARYEQLAFGLVAAQTGDGDGREVAEQLATRQIRFGFASDFVDGSDLPPEWKHAPFVVRPYSQKELQGLLERLGFLPA